MSNVNVYANIRVDIELSQEEKNMLTQTCKILSKISKDLWDDDADETETYYRAYESKETLRDFLKCDIGIELDNYGEIIDVQ